jgi:transposase
MLDETAALPEDPEELRAFTTRLLAEVKAQAILIEKLRHQLAGHRAHRFGASSETAEQLQLALETSEIAAAAMTARLRLRDTEEKDRPKRRPIPDHVPRMEVELTPAADACAECGGKLRRIGEDVTEELEYVPGRFVVNRIVRPRLTCSCCERFVQAPLPSRPIERGRPGPGLLAHVLVSKYADHLPLYRQSVRQCLSDHWRSIGSPSSATDWTSTAPRSPAGSVSPPRCWSRWPTPSAGMCSRPGRSSPTVSHVAPLVRATMANPVQMLAPGTGKTQTARIWTYARDERSWGGAAPPAALAMVLEPVADHGSISLLRGPEGAASEGSPRPLPRLDACRRLCRVRRSLPVRRDPRSGPAQAHVRRKFVDIHRSQVSTIAEEAIHCIAKLYAVEKEARGSPPDRRVDLRQTRAAPVFDDLEAWLAQQLTRISGKSPLAAAIRYARARMERMRPYLVHGILELDTDVVEQPLSSRLLRFWWLVLPRFDHGCVGRFCLCHEFHLSVPDFLDPVVAAGTSWSVRSGSASAQFQLAHLHGDKCRPGPPVGCVFRQ